MIRDYLKTLIEKVREIFSEEELNELDLYNKEVVDRVYKFVSPTEENEEVNVNELLYVACSLGKMMEIYNTNLIEELEVSVGEYKALFDKLTISSKKELNGKPKPKTTTN